MNKTWLWWSSGKDSAWSLHSLRSDPEFEVTALVTTINAVVERVVAEVLEQGVTHMVFADLLLTDIRQYRESLLAGSAIKPVFPLWQRP